VSRNLIHIAGSWTAAARAFVDELMARGASVACSLRDEPAWHFHDGVVERPDGARVTLPHLTGSPPSARLEENSAVTNLLLAINNARDVLIDRDSRAASQHVFHVRDRGMARVADSHLVATYLAGWAMDRQGEPFETVVLTFQELLETVGGPIRIEPGEPRHALDEWLDGKLAPYLDALGDDLRPPLPAARRRRASRLVVCVSAYGIDAGSFDGVAATMRPESEVVQCCIRGVFSDAGRPLGVVDHAADLSAAIREAGGGPAHVVAWCTAAKPVLSLANRHPELVATIAFVAGDFAPLPGLQHAVTDWDDSLLALAGLLDRHPEVAARFVDIDAAMLEVRRSSRMFGAVGERFRNLVTRAFENEKSLLRYCSMLLEYQTHDAVSLLRGVTMPALFLVPTDDVIVHRDVVSAAAKEVALASVVLLPGETHWVLYENPLEVGCRLRLFHEWHG
jgi:pimeloyl-ACP methyl ester carboxylesterase